MTQSSRAPIRSLCFITLCLTSILHGQDASKQQPAPVPQPTLTFDVASIHESREGRWSTIGNLPGNSFYQAQRVALSSLITGAYNIESSDFLRNLPKWATTTRYDVTAKSDFAIDQALAKLSSADAYAAKRLMLQLLLADRFKLKISSRNQRGPHL